MSDRERIALVLSDISTAFGHLAHSFDELSKLGVPITAVPTISVPAIEPEPVAVEVSPEPEPVQEDETTSRLFELQAMGLRELKKIAISYGYDRQDVESADKDTLIGGILAEEEITRPREPEPVPQPMVLTKESILGMGLAEAKKLAIARGIDPFKLIGIDVDGIAHLLLDPEQVLLEDNDDDGEHDNTDTNDLLKLDVDQLKKIARQYGVVMRGVPKKETIIDRIVKARSA